MSTPAAAAPAASQDKKTDDKYGANKTKGGQLLESSFLDSITSSYANIVYSPTICLTYLVVIMVMLVEMFEPKTGPIEQAYERARKLATHKNLLIKSLGNIFIILLKVIVDNKFIFLTLVLFLVPWYRKPSTKNLVASVIFFLCAFTFELKPIPLLLLSQAWYLYTEIRNPKFKLFIMTATVIVMAFAFIESPNYPALPTPPVNRTI